MGVSSPEYAQVWRCSFGRRIKEGGKECLAQSWILARSCWQVPLRKENGDVRLPKKQSPTGGTVLWLDNEGHCEHLAGVKARATAMAVRHSVSQRQAVAASSARFLDFTTRRVATNKVPSNELRTHLPTVSPTNTTTTTDTQ
jgi:hypothetical protein